MLESIFTDQINSWFWLFLISVITFAFKDTIRNFFLGCQFMYGHDFDPDDIVYLNGETKARIVRQNVWKTTFYIIHSDKSVRKFIVPNKLLWYLYIEKELKQGELINYQPEEKEEDLPEKSKDTDFTEKQTQTEND